MHMKAQKIRFQCPKKLKLPDFSRNLLPLISVQEYLENSDEFIEHFKNKFEKLIMSKYEKWQKIRKNDYNA